MFSEIIKNYDRKTISDKIYSVTKSDVEKSLSKDKRTTGDFINLISPAASGYLEEMAELSNRLTQKRFGKTIQLYIPLYLSNICENNCVYCGFSSSNKIKRTILKQEEILKEVEILKSYGYEHVLLVAGEAPKKVGVKYYLETINLIKKHFSQICLEVQPLEQDEYKQLMDAGLNSVYVYQETYNTNNYKKYHPSGKKSEFDYRVDTPDRLGKAGIHKIGLGVLLGLEDWRIDSTYTALHLEYLEKQYWRSKFSISFPRLRPHVGSFNPNYPINDKELVQLICAYRLLDEELELSMSVRESPTFRDNIIKLGITSMSAGSKTEPGGYAANNEALEQFEVHDDRSPAEISQMIKTQGYEAVWKDWDNILQ